MSFESPRSAVVLVIDQLGASCLSPFGNTWYQTDNLCRIAAESMLFDFAISDSPDMRQSIESLWRGTHAAGNTQSTSNVHLAEIAARSGGASTLITDHVEVADMEAAAAFDRTVVHESVCPPVPASGVADTAVGNFFVRALPELEKIDDGDLLWLHCSGLAGPWDAPMDLRHLWVDEDDPDPPEFTEAPDRSFDHKEDPPDLLLGYQQVCAAQVYILDQMAGILFDQFDAMDSLQSTMLVITSTRGTATGEHRHIGRPVDLFNESIHVPLMIRYPDKSFALQRSHQLVQPGFTHRLIADWLGGSDREVETDAFLPQGDLPVLTDDRYQIAISVCDDLKAIQTPQWKLIRSPDGTTQLFVKPDDRWEVNDVASRCRHIVDLLEVLLDECLQKLASGESVKNVQVPEELDVQL
ncbi:MAG: sulfatase-like hydrolase/transferase [Planctomycetota bacterium]